MQGLRWEVSGKNAVQNSPWNVAEGCPNICDYTDDFSHKQYYKFLCLQTNELYMKLLSTLEFMTSHAYSVVDISILWCSLGIFFSGYCRLLFLFTPLMLFSAIQKYKVIYIMMEMWWLLHLFHFLIMPTRNQLILQVTKLLSFSKYF